MIYPHLDLAAGAHDRIAERRTDEEWLATRWADPDSRVLVVAGTRVRPVDGTLPWVTPDQAPDGVRVLLGERGGTTWWAVIADAALAEPKEEWFPLRGLLPVISGAYAAQAPLVFHALGLAEWHWATRHCPRCGAALNSEKAGHELRCTACARVQFPRSDPAVIMVVAAGVPGADDERCLLGRPPARPAGQYTTLAGFCEPGETLEDAVRREVREETDIHIGAVEYFGNQPWPLPASLMVGFVARADSTEIVIDHHELEDARWFTRRQMREETEAGTLALPSGVSISRSLVEHWYGGPLPGSW